MYKITLFDENMGGCCSGTITVFVSDLEEFEKHRNFTGGQLERYLKSKGGAVAVDYYGENPDLDMVQEDKDAVISPIREFVMEDDAFTLDNFYGWSSKYYAQTTVIRLCTLAYGGRFYLLGQYDLLGVCSKVSWEEEMYEVVTIWGNTVATETVSSSILENDKKIQVERERIFKLREEGKSEELVPRLSSSGDKRAFTGCDVRTFCWLVLAECDREEDLGFAEIDCISQELRQQLMSDIPGEAG